jgi:hypothetical protein
MFIRPLRQFQPDGLVFALIDTVPTVTRFPVPKDEWSNFHGLGLLAIAALLSP